MTVEPVVMVVVSSHGHGQCRACHAKIAWYKTIGGAAMPFDAKVPAPARIRFDETLHAQIGELPREFVHWRSCPSAGDFRRRPRPGR